MVTFEHLNLAEDVYPSVVTDTNAMDVVVCRNVLMYFAPAQIRRVVAKINHALVPGGWLVVAPGETSQALFPEFATVSSPGVVLYRKRPEAISWPPVPAAPPQSLVPTVVALPADPLPVIALPAPAETRPASYAAAVSFYEQGRYGDAVEALLALSAGRAPERNILSLLVRALANQGRLVDALEWCDRWIAAYKLDTVAHYLRAVVLMESGPLDDARRSLQHAVYLDGDFVLAHFALGNLARTRDRQDEAVKHYGNTLRILNRIQPDDVLPESDGLTAGRLKDTITVLTSVGTAARQRQPVRDHA
jgi:chemotaxis protein methyltransferase CheR